MLTSKQQSKLLSIARRSIENHLRGEDFTHPVVDDPDLERPGAAFVTLTRRGKLRGCIGYSEPLYPLHETVARCAVAAASQDYRFARVTPDELPELEISVSALTPLRRLDNSEDLEPGRHGLMIVSQEHRGLLLPQVAAERGWDRETFLGETCRKAGLPSDAWRREGVEIFVFEAEVFSEGEARPDGDGSSSP
jgi:AmmeMemoRadiSam system protein A